MIQLLEGTSFFFPDQYFNKIVKYQTYGKLEDLNKYKLKILFNCLLIVKLISVNNISFDDTCIGNPPPPPLLT